MLIFIRNDTTFRVTALVTAATLLQACMSTHREVLKPERFAEGKAPGHVRVRLVNGAVVAIEKPEVVGDSLVGDLADRDDGDPEHAAVALSDIKQVEFRQFSAAKTAMVVVGIGATVALMAAAMGDCCAGSWGSGGGGGDIGAGDASCPHVYSWDGSHWRLDSGTFGGAITRGLEQTDVDNLDFAAPQDGVLRLRLANELQETDYVDALAVLAVDHDSGVSVAPDGRGSLHTLGALTAPLGARDLRGHDALARVQAADGWSWESNPSGRDTTVAADLRDGLELTFARPVGAARANLVVDGNNTRWAAFLMQQFVAAHGRATAAWYDSLDANPVAAHRMFAKLADEALLKVAVWSEDRWQVRGLIWEAGPEVVKRQVLTLDLSGVSGDTVRIRLASVPSFWLIDRVSLDYSDDRPLTVQELGADAERDNVLAAVDGRALRLEPGETRGVSYRVPPVPAGKSRSYLLRSTGWYRIHMPATADPQVALLHRLMTEPDAVSRYAVSRMNDALRAMAVAAR